MKTSTVVGAKNDWATLEITMPLDLHIPTYSLVEKILAHFPNAFLIIRYILGL